MEHTFGSDFGIYFRFVVKQLFKVLCSFMNIVLPVVLLFLVHCGFIK